MSDIDDYATFLLRFYPDESTGCWEWVGRKTKKGYGRFSYGGRVGYAHRYSYQKYVGEIEEGMTIDHVCENKGCVNPEHLEQVEAAENWRRYFYGRTMEGPLYALEACDCCGMPYPLESPVPLFGSPDPS